MRERHPLYFTNKLMIEVEINVLVNVLKPFTYYIIQMFFMRQNGKKKAGSTEQTDMYQAVEIQGMKIKNLSEANLELFWTYFSMSSCVNKLHQGDSGRPIVSALLKRLVITLSMLLSSQSFSSVRYTSTLQCFTNIPCSTTWKNTTQGNYQLPT